MMTISLFDNRYTHYLPYRIQNYTSKERRFEPLVDISRLVGGMSGTLGGLASHMRPLVAESHRSCRFPHPRKTDTLTSRALAHTSDE